MPCFIFRYCYTPFFILYPIWHPSAWYRMKVDMGYEMKNKTIIVICLSHFWVFKVVRGMVRHLRWAKVVPCSMAFLGSTTYTSTVICCDGRGMMQFLRCIWKIWCRFSNGYGQCYIQMNLVGSNSWLKHGASLELVCRSWAFSPIHFLRN